MSNFNLYSRYYDLLYEDKNTVAECDYVLSLHRRFSEVGNVWLEFGAGSGRHGAVFQTEGIQWTGIERSPDMAEQGQSKGLTMHVGDIRHHQVGQGQFGVVLSLFHVISYLPGNQDVIDTFRNAAYHLKNGGVFIFDIWYSPAVYNQKPEYRQKKVAGQGLQVEREATPNIYWNENTINVHYDIRVEDSKTGAMETFSEDHLMRHFSLPELKLFATLAGFDFVHAEEWLTGHPPGPDTWGVCCILKKRS